MSHPRFSGLSTQRQALIRRCQRIAFGKIAKFAVQDGEPLILPETEVFIDVKLDSDDVSRPELGLEDFDLPAEVVRLFAKMDAVRDGTVDHVEVRAGVPRRIVFTSFVQS